MCVANAKRPPIEATFTGYLSCVFSACSASVSHLSAISMKKDLCAEVRAASANRMHSAALLRNWSKLGKSVSISIHMETDRAYRQRFVISRSMSFKCIPM